MQTHKNLISPAAVLAQGGRYAVPEAFQVIAAIAARVGDYKAPHAPRGTPRRPRRRLSSVLSPRLYKGHRP